MGSLFQADGQLTRFRSLSTLGKSPQDFRRRAAECRELAQTCLTEDAGRILSDLADDLEREAYRLEEPTGAIAGGGRY